MAIIPVTYINNVVQEVIFYDAVSALGINRFRTC